LTMDTLAWPVSTGLAKLKLEKINNDMKYFMEFIFLY
jgi:hypothetical protein